MKGVGKEKYRVREEGDKGEEREGKERYQERKSK